MTQAQLAIREKLQQMKNLFEDEEEAEAGKGAPESAWDLHDHKIQYDEALKKREEHLEQLQRRGNARADLEAASGALKKDKNETNNFEMHEDELRDFLANRINELKRADEAEPDGDAGKFKFRASTIANVLPSGHFQEHSRLEANYRKRYEHPRGEVVHQKLILDQRRKVQKRNSALRQSHALTREMHKKEVVSTRSNYARSPSSASAGSPRGPFAEVGTPPSPTRGKRRQINTDLDAAQAAEAQRDGLST